MNRNLAAGLSLATVVAAAAAAAAALILPRNAFAGDITAGDISIDPTPFVGTRTKAEVRDELLKGPRQFRHDTDWGEQQSGGAPYKSGLSRRDVRADYEATRDQVQALTGEDSGSNYLKMHPLPGQPASTMGGPAK